MSSIELGNEVGLSPSASHRRVKLLEESGIIEKYVAVLNGHALGFRIEFHVEITLSGQTEQRLDKFEKAIGRIPEVLECALMTGEYDYFVRIAARDTDDYERIHRQSLANLPGVVRIKSSLMLRSLKPWAGYLA
jgi:Lrp/AsnC family leucine-responsive transcriptional regulator